MQLDSLELSHLDQAKRFEQLSRAVAQLAVVDIALPEIFDDKTAITRSLGRGLLLVPGVETTSNTRYVIEPRKQVVERHVQLAATDYGHLLRDTGLRTATDLADLEALTPQLLTPQDLLVGGDETAEQSKLFVRYAAGAHRFVMRAYTQQKMQRERYYHDVF